MNNDYNSFKTNFQAEELPELALYRPQYPYGECAVIINKMCNVKTEQLDEFCKQEDFHLSIMNNAAVLSSRKPLVDKNGITYIFSGITRYKDKLIFGDDDIQLHNISVSDLLEETGEFELLTFYNDKLELSTDFLGMCHWYYYKENNKFFAAATSYHLLLLILKNYGIKMRLNTKKVSAGMAFMDQSSQNSFTYNMDVENCFELPPDKKIIINNEILFENTNLYNEIHYPETYNDELYEKYLFQAKEEIIANVRAVLEHPKFKNVICDLTGGVDSRIVIASALNLPVSLTKKIKIYSNKKSAEDYRISCSIVNVYGLKWAEELERIKSLENKRIINDKIYQATQSCFLGTHYNTSFTVNNDTSFFLNSINLTGGCGGAIYKNFGARIFQTSNFDDYFKAISEYHTGDVSYQTKAGECYKSILGESLNSMPGKTLNLKNIMFYIYFRNRHHFKTKYSDTPKFAPLQSKAALHCKLMYLTAFSDNKLPYDLMSLLNPLIANLPYEEKGADKHNQSIIELSDRLYRMQKIDIKPCYDNNNIEQNEMYIPDKQTFDYQCDTLNKWYTNEKTLLSALKVFLNYSNDFEELGLPLYNFFKNEMFTGKYKCIHADKLRINRILSIYWQIKIINGSR